ncbi:hypothetical protein HELRODRAFT_82307, partial [Helobdella robusta]|uniref:Uncharacterized protein n=1 Tax=Helobdella robusta TaxID=6412 RepID=T1G4Q5_HELRO
SGKTALSNLLSEVTSLQQEPIYKATKGCRILEFEVPNLQVDDKVTKVDVELWDCSGDTKYSSCWPAMANNCQGILLVYDYSNVNPNELNYW